jgi:histone H3/H4
MKKNKKEVLSLAAVNKLIKIAGAERVSESASKALRKFIEEYGANIAKKSIIFARHMGRKTVKGEDVKRAFKSLNQ